MRACYGSDITEAISMPKLPPPPRAASVTRDVAELLQNGLAMHQSGRGSEAAQLYEQALAIDPAEPAANHLLGLVRLQQGDFDDAVRLIARAVAVNAEDAQYLGNLGVALNSAKRPDEAIVAFDRALSLKTDFAEAHSNKGMALRSLDRFEAAAESYRKAIALKPREPGFHFNLANVLADAGDYHEAEAAYREALKLRPAYPGALVGLSRVLATLGHPEDAVAMAREALAFRPNEAEYHVALARALRRSRRPAEAAEGYRRAILLDPTSGEAHLSLSSLIRHSEVDAEVLAMDQLFSDEGQPTAQRVYAGFGLGKALADVGQHQRSCQVFLEANALKRRGIQFSIERAVKEMDELSMASISTDALDARSVSEAAPIFVLGLPRAGKTTVEAMLVSHTSIYGAGELKEFERLVIEQRYRYGAAGAPAPIERLPPSAVAEIGQKYVSYTRALAGAGRVVVDTMPPNFRLIGIIRASLPNARIVHCIRDPIDHCVAIFEKHFGHHSYDYSYDLRELATYYRGYRRVMSRWNERFPGAILEVDVGRLSPSGISGMLRYCGLDPQGVPLTVPQSEPELGPRGAGSRPEDRAQHLRAYQALAELLNSLAV